MNKIYFTADLHFGHTNILKHQPNRLFAGENDSTKHDEWLLELWRNTVGKKDMIYILGDLTFLKSEGARLLLEKLPGRKYMDGDMESQTLRLHHASWSLPWKAR